MKTPNVRFSASLSNGQTVHEGFGNFGFIEGQLSPWQRLQKHIAQNKIEITSLSLITPDGVVLNTKSAGRNPKFQAFYTEPMPIDFNFFRRAAQDINIKTGSGKGEFEVFAVSEAIYKDFKAQIWVDDLNPKNIWFNIIK